MFTAIREGIYSERFPTYTGFPDLQDLPEELKIPHDGSGPGIAFAKIDDLGEATAKLVIRRDDEFPVQRPNHAAEQAESVEPRRNREVVGKLER